jgi:hypothetical protein
LRLPGVLVLVLVASLSVRWANHLRRSWLPAGDPAAGWFCTDPDSLYHMRRVERFLSEGSVAAADPLLGAPLADTPLVSAESRTTGKGAGQDRAATAAPGTQITSLGTAIPWPPVYTRVLGLFCSSFKDAAPEARRRSIEQLVASLPLWFGGLTSLLVALCAADLVRRMGAERRAMSSAPMSSAMAALVAGLYHAFAFGSLKYSHLGTGDHHAFVACLSALLFLTISRLLEAGASNAPAPSQGRAIALGVGAGLLIGLLLGTWVAALALLVLVEAALAWGLVASIRPGTAALAKGGLALHLTALVVLLPALLPSPWLDLEPWSMVNLSHYHLTHLLIGAALCLGASFLFPGASPRRRAAYLVVCGAMLLMAALLTPLAGALGQAFSWVGATDPFMSAVHESQPLLKSLGNQNGGPSLAARHLGWGLFAAPWVWWALRPARSKASGQTTLIWWVSLPPLLIAALFQRRFSDLALIPLAIGLGVWLPPLVVQILAPTARPRRLHQAILFPILLALPLAAHGRVVVSTAGRIGQPEPYPETAEAIRERGRRELYAWLRMRHEEVAGAASLLEKGGDLGGHNPVLGEVVGAVGSRGGTESSGIADLPGDLGSQGALTAPPSRVLAQWDLGHAIEWYAGVGTVASNFGAYIGGEAHLVPWRFFLAADEGLAEAMLENVGARWVLLTDSFARNLETAAARLNLEQEAAAEAGRMWRRLTDGEAVWSGSHPSFLRLVHVSPVEHQRVLYLGRRGGSSRRLPAGWIWERVAGARVEFTGEPGGSCELRLGVEFPAADREMEWVGRVTLDGDGRGVVRVPYATAGEKRARWQVAAVVNSQGAIEQSSRAGELLIPEEAVLAGRRLTIP